MVGYLKESECKQFSNKLIVNEFQGKKIINIPIAKRTRIIVNKESEEKITKDNSLFEKINEFVCVIREKGFLKGVQSFFLKRNKEDCGEDKIFQQLKQLLKDNNISIVVLSEYLNKNEELKNSLYVNNIDILEGKKLFNYLIYDIVKYVATKKGKPIVELEISFLTENNNDLNIENIVLLAKKTKSLNIITNNIQRFQRLETYLHKELGILIKLSNNKRKALLKSDVIINTDFSEEVINNYTIPNDCVIINTIGRTHIRAKRFNGVNVNDYQITMPNENKLEGFRDELIYESNIYMKNDFEVVREAIRNDNIKVERLVGNNGTINEREYRRNE